MKSWKIWRKLEPKYLKYREITKLKAEFYNNKSKIFLNKIGRVQILHVYRYLKPRTSKIFLFSLQTLFEGALTYFTFIGFYKPYNLFHSILAFGFAPYLIGRYAMKIWRRYIQGKLALQGEYINEKEVKEKMEMKEFEEQVIDDDLG